MYSIPYLNEKSKWIHTEDWHFGNLGNETRSLEWEIQESGAMTQEKTLADEKENIREEKKFVFLKWGKKMQVKKLGSFLKRCKKTGGKSLFSFS